MSRILIAYASRYGQTHKIADRIAHRVRSRGHQPEVRAADELGPDSDLSSFEAVILGGAVHAGKYPKEVVALARTHRDALSQVPSAFFSVSMSAASDDAPSRKETASYLEKFSDQTGWHPEKVASFAGSLSYREYNFILRLLMRVISRGTGRPTDTSRDHEFTDWESVDRFADEIAERLSPPSPEPPPAQPAI